MLEYLKRRPNLMKSLSCYGVESQLQFPEALFSDLRQVF